MVNEANPPPTSSTPGRSPDILTVRDALDVREAYQISQHRRLWLGLGILAMLMSSCCVSTMVIALTWGDDIYRLFRR